MKIMNPTAVDPEKGQSAERWEQQLRKGSLEMATLAALWSGRLYGLEIIRRFEDSSQLALAEGTIYPILSRLKNEGLVASEWGQMPFWGSAPCSRRRRAISGERLKIA